MRRPLFIAVVLLASAAAATAGCRMSAYDRMWLEETAARWQQVASEDLGVTDPLAPELILFDRNCVWRFQPSRVPDPAKAVALRHDGKFVLPTGGWLRPAILQTREAAGVVRTTGQTVSYRRDGAQQSFVVMGLPSVWRTFHAHNADSRFLEDRLRGVAIHEFTHAIELPRFVEAMRSELGAFDGGAWEQRLESDRKVVTWMKREASLLFAAAGEKSADRRRQLVEAALASIDRRAADPAAARIERALLMLEGRAEWARVRALMRAFPKQSLGNILHFARRAQTSAIDDLGLAMALLLEGTTPAAIDAVAELRASMDVPPRESSTAESVAAPVME